MWKKVVSLVLVTTNEDDLLHKSCYSILKQEYIKDKQFDFIRQTDIKHKPNIEV